MRTSGLREGGLAVDAGVAACRAVAGFGFRVFETFLVRSVIATLYSEATRGIVQEILAAIAAASAELRQAKATGTPLPTGRPARTVGMTATSSYSRLPSRNPTFRYRPKLHDKRVFLRLFVRKDDRESSGYRPVMFRIIPSGPPENVGTVVVSITRISQIITLNQDDKTLDW